VDSPSARLSLPHLPSLLPLAPRILQTALSGNALISIICTIAPTVKCFEESNNTLKFATRAKKIKMEARVNETVDDKTLLRAYRLEIEQLKAKLAEVESVMQIKASEQQAADGVDTEENQQLMLQMIDHMERLILKGEEKAKEEEGAVAAGRDRRSSEPRRDMKTRKSEGGGLKSATASANASTSSVPASKRATLSDSPVATNPSPVSARAVASESKPPPATLQRVAKESKIAQRKVSKKGPPPLRKATTLPVPLVPATNESGEAVTETETEPREPALLLDSVDVTSVASPSPGPSVNASPLRRRNSAEDEEEEEDFFAGLSRGRESLLRASHDVNDSPMTSTRSYLPKEKDGSHGHGHSSLSLFPSVIETILSGGSRESLQPTATTADRDKVKDPVLHGVSQMLSILKQHVQKPK
jgi:hypothetical protein